MGSPLTIINPPSRDFNVANLNLSQLVGFQLKVFSNQFPGKTLLAKVVSVHDRQLAIENGPRTGPIENLVANQNLILQFAYRSQEITVRAILRRASSGQASFELEEKVTPLHQRRFIRVPLKSRVRLAACPAAGLLGRKLNKLRWIETGALNFSSGGVLLEIGSRLDSAARLLINVDQDQFDFPPLVLAKVCHSYQFDEIHCHAGVEFITRELAKRMYSPYQMEDMPSVLFSYTNARREKLNRIVREWNRNMNTDEHTGVADEQS